MKPLAFLLAGLTVVGGAAIFLFIVVIIFGGKF